MRNPAIAMQCGACLVPIAPVLHPAPETLITCPQCGASDTFAVVRQTCFDELATRPVLGAEDTRAPLKWKFRA